jgi:hypothetical protein
MDKTIGVCGFGASGSSAICDFLKEFNENLVFDEFEFKLPYIPDGIDDLAYHVNEGGLKKFSSIVAIERYKRLCNGQLMKDIDLATRGMFKQLTSKYLENIIQSSYYGRSWSDSILYPWSTKFKIQRRINGILLRLKLVSENALKKEVNFYPLHKCQVSFFPENFYDITTTYVQDILIAMGQRDDKNIVLDQPFAVNNPQKSFRYFYNPKAIIVDRDPRDLYLFNKRFLYSKREYNFPVDTVENYVRYYRNIRKGMPYADTNNDILNIYFEDMIYEYERTVKKIIDFLDLKYHSMPQSVFKPHISINNTQLVNIYPDLVEDIIYIEKELPEYLYHFEKYKEVKPSKGKMFA